MPSQVVPIKVKIEQHGNGSAKYPAFNDIAAELRGDADWSIYFEKYGGWHYDCCGHKEESEDSPRGIQFALVFVDSDFADAAVAAFPGNVQKLNAAQAATFYEGCVSCNHPEQFADVEALQAIALRRELQIPDNADVTKALDPEDDTPGIRRNKKKTLADVLAKHKLNIK